MPSSLCSFQVTMFICKGWDGNTLQGINHRGWSTGNLYCPDTEVVYITFSQIPLVESQLWDTDLMGIQKIDCGPRNIPPLWVTTEHQAELSALYTAASPLLSLLHMVVYICHLFRIPCFRVYVEERSMLCPHSLRTSDGFEWCIRCFENEIVPLNSYFFPSVI